MSLCGTASDHCCHLGRHGVCQYLVQSDNPEFTWACALRQAANSWASVYATDEYQQNVKPKLDDMNMPDCGDWPPLGVTCATCGEVGHG